MGADYADKANNRRPVSEITVTLEDTVVSHASKTQHIVALSTSEAEYIATRYGVKKALFVRVVLLSLRPRRVGQAFKSLRTTKGLRR